MRPLRPGDAPSLAALHESCFDKPWSTEEFTRLMAQPGMAAYMMEAEGRAIAMAMAHAVLDQADILTIAVHPSMRGQGLGRALMQTLERALAALGVTQVFLEVRASNKPAMLLYESLGYQRIATRPNYYGGSEDGLLMKKEMHPAA